MTLLIGIVTLSGRVHWQDTQPDNPSVLTMAFPEQVAKKADVPDVSVPEIAQGTWTIDFDAVREHLYHQTASYFSA